MTVVAIEKRKPVRKRRAEGKLIVRRILASAGGLISSAVILRFRSSSSIDHTQAEVFAAKIRLDDALLRSVDFTRQK